MTSQVSVTTLTCAITSATAAAIVKITVLEQYGKHGDFLYDSSDLTIWYVLLSLFKADNN